MAPPQAATEYKGDQATVRGLLEAFLDEIDGTVSKERFDVLTYYASLFAQNFETMLVLEIKPSTLAKWLIAPKPGRMKKDDKVGPDILWKSSTQRHAAALIKRAWKWAHNAGHIRVNAIANFALPECEYRDDVIEIDVHNRLVRHCMSIPDARPFALYLIASRCGARRQQIREVTAAHVSHDGTKWIFKKHKTVGKTKRPLIVYLPPCLQTLTRILVESHPIGPLFLNSSGKPWKSDTVTQRMERLRTRLDLPKDVVAYLYRHTLATDALLAGQTIAVVAQLLGHTDTRMVSRVYSHLEKHPSHLIDAMAKTAESRLDRGKSKR